MSTETRSPLSWLGRAGLLGLIAVAAGLTLAATADRAGVSLFGQWPFAISQARGQVIAALGEEDGNTAVAAANRLVTQAPLRRSNLSLLATAQQLSGNAQVASDIFRVASSLGWRDELAQGYAVNLALGNGEYAIAASRMEALIRAAPDSEITRQLVAVIAQVPESRAGLAAAMASGKGWGDNLIAGLHELPAEEIAQRIPLLADAYSSGFRASEPLARRETYRIFPLDPSLGWAFWNAVAGPGDTAEAGLWNAGFSTIGESGFAGRAPFEWSRARQTTQTLRVVEVDGQKRLIVSGRNFSAENVAAQAVPLAAGRYALGWRASAAKLDRPDLLLSADCAEPAAPLEVGPAIMDKRIFYRLLTVGEECKLAEVRVFAPSGGASERWIAEPRVLPIE